MIRDIPIRLHGKNEILTVEYQENTSPNISGFDALAVPFEKERCIGYPTIYAYFKDMKLTGYKRYCGFIQIVKRIENNRDEILFIDVDDYFNDIGNPYFSYGYPASLYDAPCMNLGDCNELTWQAYTYLIDMPSRMNQNKLEFITGFSWGYVEDVHGVQRLLDLEMLTELDFINHRQFINEQYPHFIK